VSTRALAMIIVACAASCATSVQMTLRPQPGAPNASSLVEGKFRNGRFSVHVPVGAGAGETSASTDVVIAYDQNAPSAPGGGCSTPQ
jgi:hypothetical protein